MIDYDARCVLFFFLSMYVLKSLSTYLLCIYYLSGLDFRSWYGLSASSSSSSSIGRLEPDAH